MNTGKNNIRKGFCKYHTMALKINTSTPHEICTEQLNPFSGLLSLIKLFDLFNFHKIVDFAFQPTSREHRLGNYSMKVGILMILFIGFNRIWHFVYIRLDICSTDFFASPGSCSQQILERCGQPWDQPGQVPLAPFVRR